MDYPNSLTDTHTHTHTHLYTFLLLLTSKGDLCEKLARLLLVCPSIIQTSKYVQLKGVK